MKYIEEGVEMSSEPTHNSPVPNQFSLLSRMYTDVEMAKIFSEQTTIALWIKVESALAQAQADVGVISQDAAVDIVAAAVPENIDAETLWKEAANVGYPILPLVQMIANSAGPMGAGRVHFGATTQDIMDTALALQLQMGGQCLLRRLDFFGDTMSALVKEHIWTVMPGRTHAQQAVPTTFGVKCAVYVDELSRQRKWITRATEQASVISLFGAGGTSASYGTQGSAVRAALSGRLGLTPTDVPWHVARDRVVYFGLAAVSLCGTVSRFAREIIDLSRTEIAEVSEPVGHHRGASSTMPQKSNPIWCEAIVGLSATATALSSALLRSMESGHERAAGEWQIEWQVVPQILNLAASAVDLAGRIADGLRVDSEKMIANLAEDSGNIMAEAYMMVLSSEMGREVAHELVYAATRLSRASGVLLHIALSEAIPPHLYSVIALLKPSDYLGEPERICNSALEAWATRTSN